MSPNDLFKSEAMYPIVRQTGDKTQPLKPNEVKVKRTSSVPLITFVTVKRNPNPRINLPQLFSSKIMLIIQLLGI